MSNLNYIVVFVGLDYPKIIFARFHHEGPGNLLCGARRVLHPDVVNRHRQPSDITTCCCAFSCQTSLRISPARAFLSLIRISPDWFLRNLFITCSIN